MKEEVVANYIGVTVKELLALGKKAKGDLIKYGFIINNETILQIPYEDYTGKNLVPLTFQLSITRDAGSSAQEHKRSNANMARVSFE